MVVSYRCFCTYRKCDGVVDANGERGVPLNARAYRLHKTDQRNADLRARALQAQQIVLKVQEETIANALTSQGEEAIVKPLQGLSIGGSHQETPEEKQYRIHCQRRMVSHIAEVKDQLEHLRAEVAAIGKPPSRPVDEDVLLSLKRCSDIREMAAGLASTLALTGRGAARKDPPVKFLREETRNDLESFIKELDGIQSSWENVMERHNDQRQAELNSGSAQYDTEYHFRPVFADATPIIQLVALMIVACHVILGFPRRGCHWLFSMCEYIIQVTVEKAGPITNYFRNILSGFPRDVRTATDQFHLEGKATVYAACPKCHTTYEPVYDDGSAIPTYRERCNFKRYSLRCGELLVRPKVIRKHRIFVPIKPYIVFDFKDWMAGLLSRSGYEKIMDKAWEKMTSPPGELHDIMQGSIIREFKGPDKKTHFSCSGEEGTGRYLFSLSCDFFNPLRNLAGGKKVSIGVIALVCVNLPIELRYLAENMFLAGIIPGVQEPSLDGINPYLRPIVDAFLHFWHGVRFSRTALYALGRMILCAIIAIVCDLPAARKVGGFAAHSHEYFCTVCRCTRTAEGYNDFNYSSWKWRTNEECRRFAERYQSAPSEKAARSSFDRSGLRSSELLRLPYYDPTKFLVVDPMHNLFLGLIKEHFQNILGYKPTGSGSNSEPDDPLSAVRLHVELTPTLTNPLPEKTTEKASVRKLISLVNEPLEMDDTDTENTAFLAKVDDWTKKLHVAALVYVGHGLGCLSSSVGSDGKNSALPHSQRMSKKDLRIEQNIKAAAARAEAEAAIQSGDEPAAAARQARSLKHGQIFTTDEMEALWGDIENMIKPSWATSVPDTLSSSGPKLKSDQWRAVGALYLPVTLIRLWSDVDPNNKSSQKRRELLDLTMSLLSAICIATSRVTSGNHAEQYLAYMMKYCQGLKHLFPGYKCHPNHHMAMHIGENLRMYGPVHGWWTFPFERMIGTLQRIETNYKLGEYEETIARSWHRCSNFKAFFRKSTCPEAIRYCAEKFETLVRPQNRNTLSISILDGFQVRDVGNLEQEHDNDTLKISQSTQAILPDVREALIKAVQNTKVPHKAASRNRISIEGISYTVNETHEGNSGVLCHGSSIAFCIVDILQFPKDEGSAVQGTWFVVWRHREAGVAEDPYGRYPYLRAKMWSVELAETLEVLPLTAIKTHFAKCIIPWKGESVAVVVDLARVI